MSKKQEVVGKKSLLERIKEAQKVLNPIWIPGEDSNYIVGRLENVRTVKGKLGDSTILDIRSAEDGVVYSVWVTAVIESELKRQNAKLGDDLGLKYLGRKERYHDFVVIVDKPEEGEDK